MICSIRKLLPGVRSKHQLVVHYQLGTAVRRLFVEQERAAAGAGPRFEVDRNENKVRSQCLQSREDTSHTVLIPKEGVYAAEREELPFFSGAHDKVEPIHRSSEISIPGILRRIVMHECAITVWNHWGVFAVKDLRVRPRHANLPHQFLVKQGREVILQTRQNHFRGEEEPVKWQGEESEGSLLEGLRCCAS